MVPAIARPRAQRAIPSQRLPGIWGNAGYDRSCRRSGYGRTCRSRSARHGRRALPCGSSRHHLELAEADMAGVGLAPRRSMAAEDIRNLQLSTCQQRRASGWRLGLGLVVSLLLARVFGLVHLGPQRRQAVERAHDLADRVGGDARVERRRLKLGMTEQDLDHPNVNVLFEQVGREAMAQG